MSGTRIKSPRKGFATWTVVGEPTIEELSERLWLVHGHLPDLPLGRMMAVVRMEDGRLLLHSPVALPEADMARIEAWGEVAYIVVPNRFHRLDAAPFAERYPAAEVVVPAGARARVEEVVPVQLTYDEFSGDGVVSLEHAAGVGAYEGVMTVRDETGVTLVFTDLFFNAEHGGGFYGLVLRVLGSTGGPRVTRLFRFFALEDKEALRLFLRRQAATEGLVRVVPGHGAVITDAPAAVLSELAERL